MGNTRVRGKYEVETEKTWNEIEFGCSKSVIPISYQMEILNVEFSNV